MGEKSDLGDSVFVKTCDELVIGLHPNFAMAAKPRQPQVWWWPYLVLALEPDPLWVTQSRAYCKIWLYTYSYLNQGNLLKGMDNTTGGKKKDF